MKRAKFTARAQVDLRQIAFYIAQENPARATTFVDEIIAHCHAIAAQPGVGRARPEFGPAIRSLPHGRYLIFYKAIETGIEVVHVLHGARDIKPLLFDDN